jgi:DNA-binding PadR family transcriptional regulator
MSKLSNVEMAILGLLYEETHHGYELDKIVKARGMRIWTEIGFSSIYYVLKKMEKKGLITSRMQQVTGKPPRSVYSITDLGRQMMREQVGLVLSEYQKSSSPFDLGIAYHGVLSPDAVLLSFGQYLRSLDEKANEVEQLIQKRREEQASYHVIAILERTLAHVKTERAFVESLVMKIQRGLIPRWDW